MLDNKYNGITDVNEITDDLLNRFKTKLVVHEVQQLVVWNPMSWDVISDEYSGRINLDDNYFEDENTSGSKNNMMYKSI